MAKPAADEWLHDLLGWVLKGAGIREDTGPAATLPPGWDKYEFAVAKSAKKQGKAVNKEHTTDTAKMSARAAG
jgi:hypothetical protein